MDIVPLKDNHDGSTQEPVTFLPVIPTVLLNGISGIAVGWSTEILPHSLDSLVKATMAALEGKKIPKLVPSYDYLDINVKPVPGNPNSWEFTGKVSLVDTSTARVTELPPDLTLAKFRLRLAEMEEKGVIVDFIDKSTKTINVEVKFKRGALKDYTVEQLVSLLKLTSKKKERIVVIDWDGEAIREYPNPEDVVKDFVEWRFKRYIERYEKRRDDTNDELNFWKGVKLCYEDNLPDRIMKMADRKAVENEVSRIAAKVKLTEGQVDRITNFASYRWAKDGYQQCKDRIAELTKQHKEYVRLLKNPDEIKGIFKDEVAALGKVKFK